VQINKIRAALVLSLIFSVLTAACSSGGPTGNLVGPVDPNETAATVNGKVITMEAVDRGVKQQTQGQESRLSPLELAGARLQVLQGLIEREVMFQKAEKEATVPTEEEVTAAINKQKTDSGKSADQIEKEMKDAGMTEAALRDQFKKELAIQKLVDKITGKIEPPKDSEIEAFYNGNKEAFVKKRGVKLAAIVIDPANSGAGDTTTDEQSAALKGNEVVGKLRAGQDFATLAREYSEDQSKFQGGDLGYIAEQELKQTFDPQIAADFMNPATQIGKMNITQSQGKFFVLKLQERSDKDEALTLESPGVRQQVSESLVNSRKQLLAASYQAVAMNEAKIANYLAQKVVSNPNELSGARPAGASTPAAANTTAANTSNSNSGANAASNANTNANSRPAASPARPAANAPANNR